jgi:hypothetical protein
MGYRKRYSILKNSVYKVPRWLTYGPKNLNFDRFVFSDVRSTVTTSVILLKKIQIYTFLDAGNSHESIGTLNFYI